MNARTAADDGDGGSDAAARAADLAPPARAEPRPAPLPGGRSGRHLEGGHLDGGGLARNAGSGRRRGLVGFPVLTGDVGVGCDRTLGRGQQGEGLQRHLGGEQAGALGLALEAGRTVAVLVAVVVEQLAGELHRGRLLGAVELRGPEGGTDEGADDPLQVDLQGLLVQRRPERLGGRGDVLPGRVADAVVVDGVEAEGADEVVGQAVMRGEAGEPVRR